jgi:hypothetical protein
MSGQNTFSIDLLLSTVYPPTRENILATGPPTPLCATELLELAERLEEFIENATTGTRVRGPGWRRGPRSSRRMSTISEGFAAVGRRSSRPRRLVLKVGAGALRRS